MNSGTENRKVQNSKEGSVWLCVKDREELLLVDLPQTGHGDANANVHTSLLWMKAQRFRGYNSKVVCFRLYQGTPPNNHQVSFQIDIYTIENQEPQQERKETFCSIYKYIPDRDDESCGIMWIHLPIRLRSFRYFFFSSFLRCDSDYCVDHIERKREIITGTSAEFLIMFETLFSRDYIRYPGVYNRHIPPYIYKNVCDINQPELCSSLFVCFLLNIFTSQVPACTQVNHCIFCIYLYLMVLKCFPAKLCANGKY